MNAGAVLVWTLIGSMALVWILSIVAEVQRRRNRKEDK